MAAVMLFLYSRIDGFVNLRKYHQGNPINHPGIHYREFLPKQLAEMMRNGDLAIAVDQIYPMSDFKKAVLRAQDSGRSGKVILDLSVD